MSKPIWAEVISQGCYLPEREVTNDELVARNPYWVYQVDEETGTYARDAAGNLIRDKEIIHTSEGISTKMGPATRRWAAPDQSVSNLGARAVMNALEQANLPPDKLEGIIVATVTGRRYPSVACEIQEQIKAQNARYAVDIGAACAGFPIALNEAQLLLRYQKPGYYAVVASEILSRRVAKDDANLPLFGDGAGAIILGSSEERKGVLGFYSGSDPFEKRKEFVHEDAEGLLRMPRGQPIMQRAIPGIVKGVQEIQEQLGWSEVDIINFHQANIRINKGVKKRLGFPDKVFYETIREYGNMSAVACAVGYAEACAKGKIRPGSKVIIVSIGSGLVTASVGVLVS